jgi:hypothetical protein
VVCERALGPPHPPSDPVAQFLSAALAASWLSVLSGHRYLRRAAVPSPGAVETGLGARGGLGRSPNAAVLNAPASALSPTGLGDCPPRSPGGRAPAEIAASMEPRSPGPARCLVLLLALQAGDPGCVTWLLLLALFLACN